MFRPPKNPLKIDPVVSEAEEEEDQDLLEAKIVLHDVDVTGIIFLFKKSCMSQVVHLKNYFVSKIYLIKVFIFQKIILEIFAA